MQVAFTIFLQILFATSCHGHQKVVLILLDGFRYDYPLENQPGFQKIIENGVKAKSFKPVFPSLSFTNYYSIATGLYPESHGIIHNYIYDPKEDKEFLIGSRESDFESFWWKDGEPVWISAEKMGKKSVMYYWPGCEARIQNRLPTICVKYSGVPSLPNLAYAVDETVKGLAGDADFAAIYYEYIDKHGHQHGPGSSAVLQDITEIGNEIQRLLAALETTNMADGSGKLSSVTNIIIVSDHGMAKSENHQHVVMGNLIDRNNLQRALPSNWHDTVVQLWPKEGQLESMYQALSNTEGLTPYKRSDLPARWHFKDNDRVPPITVVAEDHYSLLSPTFDGDLSQHEWSNGMHGYDNDFKDMGGLFIATGPAFKSGLETSELESIEIYQIMCAILEVPAAPHNGTWKNVEDIMETNNANFMQTSIILLLLLAVMYLFR